MCAAHDACLTNVVVTGFVGIGREMLSHFGWVCMSSLLAATVWLTYSLLLFTSSLNFGEGAETFKILVNVKLSRYTMQVPREERYSSYSFLTSALDGGEWSASRPRRALPPVPIG
jgi:hypothetical protein